MILLGFADDVMDLPWRYKMLLPSIASMPLLVSYGGLTTIVVPVQLRFLLGDWIDIGADLFVLSTFGHLRQRIFFCVGLLYQVYMGLLAVFCTNVTFLISQMSPLERFVFVLRVRQSTFLLELMD